jgi:hypothetical protein
MPYIQCQFRRLFNYSLQILIIDVIDFFVMFNNLFYLKYFFENHIFYYDLFYY